VSSSQPSEIGTYASGDTLGNARAAFIGEAIVVRNRGRNEARSVTAASSDLQPAFGDT
jgi:hypothetical protein